MKKNIARTLILAGLSAGLLAYSPTISAATCSITFDNPSAMLRVFDSAKATFAFPGTYVVENNKKVQKICPNLTNSRLNHPNCTNYEQLCATASGDSYVFVWDQSPDRHYHLMFEDPRLDASCSMDGGYGRKLPNGECDSNAPVWYIEHRYAVSMAPNAWWEIGVYQPSTKGLRVFNLDSISVGSVPIQIWFRKTDGSVWGWSNLGANTNWSLGKAANDIVIAWVSGAPSARNVFTIYGFNVTTP